MQLGLEVKRSVYFPKGNMHYNLNSGFGGLLYTETFIIVGSIIVSPYCIRLMRVIVASQLPQIDESIGPLKKFAMGDLGGILLGQLTMVTPHTNLQS